MKPTNTTILVFEVNYLGDFVCMMPTITGLREMLPQAHITLITSNIGEELIRHSGLVNEVLSFDFEKYRKLWKHPLKFWKLSSRLRRRGFAASISAHDECTTTALLAKMAKIPLRIGFRSNAKGSWFYTHHLEFNPNLHVIENRFRTLQVLAEEMTPTVGVPPIRRSRIRYSDRESESVARMLDNAGCTRLVAIHPFAKLQYKEWPLNRFVQLAEEIVASRNDTGCVLVSAGRPIPGPAHPRICILNKTTLLELAALLDKADVFVGNNSGPMHIAAAQGIKTIWINGPSPSYWHGYWNDVYLNMISANVSCQPCEKPGIIPRKCRNTGKPMLCMQSIEVSDVLSAVVEALQSSWRSL